MKKLWLIIAGVVLLVSLVGLAACSGQNTTGTLELSGNLNNQQEGIWVSGEGKVAVVPDVAILTLGIQSQEATVAEAREKAAAAMDEVMKALKDAGIDDKDIQTQYFSIYPVTRWNEKEGESIITGYQVTNTVTARIRDTEKAGDVIDAVAGAGGDLTRINNIGFEIGDPTPYLEQARKLAVENAKAKAQQLADVAGVKLGKPTYINESASTPGPVYRGEYAIAEDSAGGIKTSVSPGEQQVTVYVQIAYAMQ